MSAATPLTIALGCGALAVAIAWSASLAVRGPEDGQPPLDARRRASAAAAIASVALACLGAKWWLVSEYGSSVPFFDAWEGEGLQVYLRLVAGDLRWSDLLAPHNEHRIAIQRLFGAGLLVANGQWDARLQMVVNAAVHVLAGTVLLAVLWRQAGRRHLGVLSVLVLLVWALPLGWQNTLNGFQLSFYLLVLLFVLSIALLPGAVPGSARWYLGVVAVLLSLFTLGSGLANAAAVAVALALGWLAEPMNRRGVVPGLVACLAVVMLGMGIALPSHVSGPVQFEPIWRSFREWMAWPASASALSAIVIWVPMLVLTVASLRPSGSSAPIDRTLIAIGVWVGLNGAAVAYGRAFLGIPLASRYFDILSLGFVANAAAIVVLSSRQPSGRARALASAAGVAWALWTVPGLARHADEALHEGIPTLNAAYRNHVTNLRLFIETEDIATLAARKAPFEIPHPNASLLAGFLTHETFRRFLPPDLRPPSSIVAEDSQPGRWSAFRHPAAHGPLSALAFELARAWKVVVIGAALLAWLAVRLARTPGTQSKSG